MFQFKNEAERAIVYLYGTIGEDFWSAEDSNTAKNFSKELDALEGKPVDIRIDSCGGDVYEGFAIASAIQRYEGQTTVYIDGIAASAASYIALMADKVVMNDYAQFMIHDAWTYAMGNAAELLETASRLEALDQTIASIISARTGMELDEVKAAMDAETWYSADEAKENGFCDEVVKTEQRMAASLDKAIMARFKNAPKAVTEPEEPGESHAANNLTDDEGEKTSFMYLGGHIYEVKE